MGMYTEFYIDVNLKHDTPDAAVSVIKAMCNMNDRLILENYPGRWSMLFNILHKFERYNPKYGWELIGRGSIKNYNKEIQQFFAWIEPWVNKSPGSFIGYHLYEEDREPTLVYTKNKYFENIHLN